MQSQQVVRPKLKRKPKRANTQLLNVEELFNTKDTWPNLAAHGRHLVDSGDRFLAVRVLEQSVRNWLQEKEEAKQASPSANAPLSTNALLNSSGRQSNKKTIRDIEKKLRPECPELAGIIHLLMHMLMKNKDWNGVMEMVDFLFSSEDIQRQLSQAERDDLKLRKAVASHTIEFKKTLATSLAFDTVKANFQEAHPGFHSKPVAGRGLKHLAFLQQQAMDLELEAAPKKQRQGRRLRPISGPPPEVASVEIATGARPVTP